MAFLHRPYCLYVCHRDSEHAHAMRHVVNAMGRVVVLLCVKEVDTGARYGRQHPVLLPVHP